MKKYAAYSVAFLDILCHSTLLFSWPILTQIYKSEGFFSCKNSTEEISEFQLCSESSQDASIARIMILAVAFCISELKFLDTLISEFAISLRSINLIWALLSSISFILGIFVIPWHNVEVNTESVETILDLKSKQKPLLNSEEESIPQQFKNNIKFLKSPILLFYGASLIFGNFVVTCTLSLTNFIVEKKMDKLNLTEEYDPEDIVSKFNLIRPIIAAVAAPFIGLMVDLVRKKILKKKEKPENIDLRSMIWPYFLLTISSLIFSITISIDNVFCLALALTCLSLNSTWVYVVYTVGMEINLPGQTIGIAFALCEIAGSIFAFIADPIAVFVLEEDDLELFYVSIWSTTFLMFLFGLLLPSIAFNKTSDCLKNLDSPRQHEVAKQFQNEQTEENILLKKNCI
ncbi:Oidioi.mRNA.OKI2018_I69.chr1.g1852.t1.cds [Oikopleura dioica]|uniref:Oidioi.mRNA.OKI2018_I69.chr1.g1852.t1.cds n=1 Tax=Oikopleura dioica TaxID=34765 RepID=A0ABN7SYC6_OIKDI|nr:Oidioi.mRNA.OKI2018_I69.chr1.g1852.t1.cds [Oikopleura dioica]